MRPRGMSRQQRRLKRFLNFSGSWLTVSFALTIATNAHGQSSVHSISEQSSATSASQERFKANSHLLSDFTSEVIPVSSLSPEQSGKLAASGFTTSVFAALKEFGMEKSARSVRLLEFSARHLFDDSGRGRVQLLGHSAKRLRKDSPFDEDWLVYRTTDLEGTIYLSVDHYAETVTGFALLGSRAYEIRPPPRDAGATLGRSTHLLIELPQLNRNAADVGDYGDAGAPAPSHSNAGPFTATCTTTAQSRVAVQKPLTVAVAYTKAADRKSREQNMGVPTQAGLSALGLTQALADAGVDVKVQIAGRPTVSDYIEPSVDDPKVLYAEVRAMTDSQDPALVGFRAFRKALKADIGVLIVDHSNETTCGWARDVGTDAPNAVVVVNWRCMTRKLSMMHEIGHILGAYHDDAGATANPAYAKAFISTQSSPPFVTLMGKEQDCSGIDDSSCFRIPYFSDPGRSYDGVVIGDGLRNNACLVRQTSSRIVGFGDQL